MVASCAQLDFSTCPPVDLFGSQGYRGGFASICFSLVLLVNKKSGTPEVKTEKSSSCKSENDWGQQQECMALAFWKAWPFVWLPKHNTTRGRLKRGVKETKHRLHMAWSTGLGHWKTSKHHTLIITYVSLKFLYVFSRHMSWKSSTNTKPIKADNRWWRCFYCLHNNWIDSFHHLISFNIIESCPEVLVHPWKTTWNLLITQLKRKIIIHPSTSIFVVPNVNFPGWVYAPPNPPLKYPTRCCIWCLAVSGSCLSAKWSSPDWRNGREPSQPKGPNVRPGYLACS